MRGLQHEWKTCSHFSFLWLAVWCTLFWINSYFHNQKAIYYSNGLTGSTWVWESISTYALYFLKENENDINKAVSIKNNRHTLFLSTLWPNKNQSCEILCSKAGEFLETLAKGVQVGRDSPYLCSLPFIHFINRMFKRLIPSFQWKLKVLYYGRMYLQVVITLRKCSHMCVNTY